jgi:hypothetical protein
MRIVVTRFFRVAGRAFQVGEELADEALSFIDKAGRSIDYLLAIGHLVRAKAPPVKQSSKKPPAEAVSLIPTASKTE